MSLSTLYRNCKPFFLQFRARENSLCKEKIAVEERLTREKVSLEKEHLQIYNELQKANEQIMELERKLMHANSLMEELQTVQGELQRQKDNAVKEAEKMTRSEAQSRARRPWRAPRAPRLRRRRASSSSSWWRWRRRCSPRRRRWATSRRSPAARGGGLAARGAAPSRTASAARRRWGTVSLSLSLYFSHSQLVTAYTV
jgi:TolA-binding protein